jgi:hypothetical protein
LASKQKSIKFKTRKSSGFRNLLWEVKVSEIETKSYQIRQNNDIHHLYKEGFDNLLDGFSEFITENNINYDNEFGYFKIYSSAVVESTDIIRTAEKFYGNEWFSNIAVSAEEAVWYGKVYFNFYYNTNILFHYITSLI